MRADSELRSGWARRSWELWGLRKPDRGPQLYSAMWGVRTGTQRWRPRRGVSKREFSICPRGAGARYKGQSRGFAHRPPHTAKCGPQIRNKLAQPLGPASLPPRGWRPWYELPIDDQSAGVSQGQTPSRVTHHSRRCESLTMVLCPITLILRNEEEGLAPAHCIPLPQ